MSGDCPFLTGPTLLHFKGHLLGKVSLSENGYVIQRTDTYSLCLRGLRKFFTYPSSLLGGPGAGRVVRLSGKQVDGYVGLGARS